MSAINSNSDERDREALRRAQRAYEPSMEEILASIRNIITDEREPAKSAPLNPLSQRPLGQAAGPQIVYSKDAPALLRAAPEPFARAEPEPEASPPQTFWRSPQPQPLGVERPRDADPRDAEPLLSPDADDAVTSSFAALSASLSTRTAEVADDLVREMLRPMLKQWLDENLPGIVERLVRSEIQRVARGPK